jgi:hypothetical protein
MNRNLLSKNHALVLFAEAREISRRDVVFSSVVDPYSFFTDPDPELDVGGQNGSGSKSGSGSNTDPGL